MFCSVLYFFALLMSILYLKDRLQYIGIVYTSSIVIILILLWTSFLHIWFYKKVKELLTKHYTYYVNL